MGRWRPGARRGRAGGRAPCRAGSGRGPAAPGRRDRARGSPAPRRGRRCRGRRRGSSSAGCRRCGPGRSGSTARPRAAVRSVSTWTTSAWSASARASSTSASWCWASWGSTLCTVQTRRPPAARKRLRACSTRATRRRATSGSWTDRRTGVVQWTLSTPGSSEALARARWRTRPRTGAATAPTVGQVGEQQVLEGVVATPVGEEVEVLAESGPASAADWCVMCSRRTTCGWSVACCCPRGCRPSR